MLLADARLDLSRKLLSACCRDKSVATLADRFCGDGGGSARRAAKGFRRSRHQSSSIAPRCAIVGQRHNITVPISTALMASTAHARQPSNATTRAVTGMLIRRAAAGIPGPASFGLCAHAPAGAGALPRAATVQGPPYTRQVHFGDGFAATAVYQRDALAPAFRTGSGTDQGIWFDDAGLARRPLHHRRLAWSPSIAPCSSAPAQPFCGSDGHAAISPPCETPPSVCRHIPSPWMVTVQAGASDIS